MTQPADRAPGETTPAPRSLVALRRLARPRAIAEHCDMCGTAVPSVHQHLLEAAARRIVCACDACAVLANNRSGTHYRRIPRRLVELREFALTDEQWDALSIPIELAFFSVARETGQVAVVYPSPAGPTESTLSFDAWSDIVAANPVLNGIEPEVEALLVNRIRRGREDVPPGYFIVPIDECYKLVGLMRLFWRGISGGSEVWGEIETFFAHLKERAASAAEVGRA